MVNKQDDGGPAFPVPEVWAGEQPIREGWGGMTLRDYFAAKAMPAIVRTCASDTRNPGESIQEYFARQAYAIADAMLKARA